VISDLPGWYRSLEMGTAGVTSACVTADPVHRGPPKPLYRSLSETRVGEYND